MDVANWGKKPPCPSWLSCQSTSAACSCGSPELPQHAPQCDVHRKLGPTETWQILGSMRRSSFAGTCTFMSLSNALYLTRAPASLQIRATMRSVGARFLSRPVLGRAVRWCPCRSRGSWHPLHRASVTSNGRANRSSNSTRKRCGGTVCSGAVGAWDNFHASHAISSQYGSMPLPEGHAETMPQPSAKETRTSLQHRDQKQVIKVDCADLTVCSDLWSNNASPQEQLLRGRIGWSTTHALSPTTTPLHRSRSLRVDSTLGLWRRCDGNPRTNSQLDNPSESVMPQLRMVSRSAFHPITAAFATSFPP